MSSFLLDEGLPRSLVKLLRNAKHECQHVAEIGLLSSADDKIIDHARTNRQICITLDADFHAILARAGATTPSVMRFRIEGLKAQDYIHILEIILPKVSQDLESGALISIQSQSVRIRRLPILPKRQEQ
jgi:predicted nuclease of predicted toxin-antitoxin system